MTFTPPFIDTLFSTRWLSACGTALVEPSPFALVQVSSWNEAEASCSTIDWENTTLEARNDLGTFLQLKNMNRFSEWNEITKKAKAEIVFPLTEKVWSPYLAREGLGKEVLDCIQWDVLAACMEDAYRDFVGLPHFFADLLAIYRAGHFPCGWSGAYPNGKLIVW
jgi:hypothetical protein